MKNNVGIWDDIWSKPLVLMILKDKYYMHKISSQRKDIKRNKTLVFKRGVCVSFNACGGVSVRAVDGVFTCQL